MQLPILLYFTMKLAPTTVVSPWELKKTPTKNKTKQINLKSIVNEMNLENLKIKLKAKRGVKYTNQISPSLNFGSPRAITDHEELKV